MDEIDRATNLKDGFLHSSIVSREWVALFCDKTLQVTPSAIVQDQEHLFTLGDEEVLVEGNNIWMSGDELVVVYFVYDLVEPVVDVVGGWDAGWVWVCDVNDFHSATDVSINPARQLEVNDLVHCAESTSANAALDKVPISDGASDEGGFGGGSGHRAIQWSNGEGHCKAGQTVVVAWCMLLCGRCVLGEVC